MNRIDSFLELATQHAPNEARYFAALAWARFCRAPDKSRVAAETRQMLNRAIVRSETPVLPHYYLGMVERILNRKEQALEHFREILKEKVVDVRADSNAPASVALLVDGSGSMRLGLAQAFSRQISTELLAGLNPARDTAALLSFDTRLLTLCEFTRDFEQVRSRMNHVESFGSTSLYDAVAGSAAMVAERVQNRRAVIVLTDGLDNSSAY